MCVEVLLWFEEAVGGRGGKCMREYGAYGMSTIRISSMSWGGHSCFPLTPSSMFMKQLGGEGLMSQLNQRKPSYWIILFGKFFIRKRTTI